VAGLCRSPCAHSKQAGAVLQLATASGSAACTHLLARPTTVYHPTARVRWCARRYGDEQHLDEALDKIFRFNKPNGTPRKMCPILRGEHLAGSWAWHVVVCGGM
jgi:hypothetical protein